MSSISTSACALCAKRQATHCPAQQGRDTAIDALRGERTPLGCVRSPPPRARCVRSDKPRNVQLSRAETKGAGSGTNQREPLGGRPTREYTQQRCPSKRCIMTTLCSITGATKSAGRNNTSGICSISSSGGDAASPCGPTGHLTVMEVASTALIPDMSTSASPWYFF